MKNFKIDGYIQIPDMTEDEFWDKFIGWCEQNDFFYSGGIEEDSNDDDENDFC